MALVASYPPLPLRHSSSYTEEDDMSTIPDPRSRVMTPAIDGSPSKIMNHHPDLNDEVATLSTKLINAINYQTNLDDTLSATRCELDSAKDRLKQLEAKVKTHEDQISQGILVEKAVADVEKDQAVTELAEEKKRRIEVEKAKKDIELELETLTTALFEEANNMVTSAREEARKEMDLVNRRNEQLKTQVADTEALLKSHQDQLAQLKMVMEQMNEDRTNSTAPPTPGLSKADSENFGIESMENLTMSEDLPPSYPMSFTHLLHPVLRTDLASYEDFISLVRLAKASSSTPSSRVSSGSYGSFSLGLGLYNKNSANTQAPSNSSTTSISTGTSPVTPNTPFSATSSSSVTPTSLTPLSDTKFYKRALSEDIEPCLRLDTAPGISWMARRSMLKSMCDGSLVVEPMPASTKKFSLTFPCSLCGESRSGDEFTRNHRFRISENNNAQRYPLCRYCLGRIRSSCDFVGFLRMLKDGHWRAEDDEAEKAAWEESVRLREQMFWCRVGGGVRPGPHPSLKDDRPTPRTSEDEKREQEAKISEELSRTGEIHPKDVTPAIEAQADNTSSSTKADSAPTSMVSRKASIASIRSLTSAGSARRPSTSTDSRRPSTSNESRKPSISNEVKESSTSDASPSPEVDTTLPATKNPATSEAKKASITDFKRPPIEIKRPSTASSEKASKVSNIRMMFEKKKGIAEASKQAAQDDAVSSPVMQTRSVSEKITLSSGFDTPEKDTLTAKSSTPSASTSDQPLSINIPGSFE